MTHFLHSQKVAFSLSVIAIACVVGLLLLFQQSASTYVERVTNRVEWDSQFQEGEALHGFPAGTRDHIIPFRSDVSMKELVAV